MTTTTSTSTSLPGELCLTTLDAVVKGASLTEVTAADGGPYLRLHSQMGPDEVGRMRLFTGTGAVAKAVYVGLVVPAIGLDSHMTFAFGAADSALPHFTLDSVHAQDMYAFHLDLIPRVDLASHLTYMDSVYTPLTATFEAVREWEGLTATALGPRQIAMMSTWMLVNRATPEAFARINEPVGAYRDHWLSLVGSGLSDEVTSSVTDVDLAMHDRRHRAALFSPEVDPVWDQVARLVGLDAREQIRTQLLTNDI